MVSLPIPAASPLIVGRASEQETLLRALTAASAGEGGLVLLTGEAGIGKTTLANALLRHAAAADMTVLTGRCYDEAHAPPYGLWLDLFQRYGPARLTVPPPPPFDRPGIIGDVTNPAALSAQMRQWLVDLSAAGPLLLVLEDLHWADPASVDLLRALGQVLAPLPALLLVTYRPDEVERGHPLYVNLPPLVRETDALRLTMRLLTVTDLHDFVRARYALPSADVVRLAEYLSVRAAGNPFYTVELAHSLEEERVVRPAGEGWALGDLTAASVPPLLRQVIDGRVMRLGATAGTLLDLASVIGGDISLALWARVGQVDVETVLDVVERASAAHLLHLDIDGTTARFIHDLTRDALYAGLSLAARRRSHRVVADTLIAQGAAEPSIVASHLRTAGDARALDWLLRAADHAERTYAFKSAAHDLESVVALLAAVPDTAVRRAELLLRIAGLSRFAPWTADSIREALRLAQEVGDDALIAVAELRLTFATMLNVVDLTAALATQTRARIALESLPAPTRAALTRVDAGAASLPTIRQLQTQTVAAAGDFAAVFRLLDWSPDDAYVFRQFDDGCGYIALGIAYTSLGRVGEARAAYADGVAWFLALEQRGSAAAFYEWELDELTLVFETDDRARRETLASAAERAFAGDPALPPPDLFPPRVARVAALALEGEWDEACALLATIRTKLGFSGWIGMYLPLIGALAHARGEREDAAAIVREMFPAGHATAPGSVSLQSALRMQRIAVGLALDIHDLATAAAWLEAHDRWLAWSGAVLGRADGHLAWAHYHRAMGDADAARERGEQALVHASAPRQPLALLAAHRLLGALATDAGRYAEATTHLGNALVLAAACAAPYERALTLLALAALRHACGDPDGAVALLDEAREIATRLGAAPTLARADRLAAAWAAAPATKPTYPGGLSAREVEVLRLVAAGLSNAQVAERLFLSPRTVNGHLTAIYTKLNVPSRSAAIRFAFDHGLH